MITPAYALTATERVLPRLALDFTTGVLDSRVTIARALNTATRVNSSGLIEGVNADLPRFDYDPTTLAPKGLLIEEARTNLLTYSSDFGNPIWGTIASGTGVLPVVTPDYGISPDGTQNADRLQLDSGGAGQSTIRNLPGGATTAVHTFSVYMRSLSGNVTVTMYLLDAIQNVTVTSAWQRFTFTRTPAALSTIQVQLSKRDAFSSTGAADLLVYGAQLEAGAFPTSYIPTTTTSLTRNADVVSMTGTNFSDWYNASEGTFYARGSRVNDVSFAALVSVSTDTSNEMYMVDQGDRAYGIMRSTGGVNGDMFGQIGSWPVGTVGSMVLAYKENASAISVNANAVVQDTAVTIPAVNQMNLGSRRNGISMNGHLAKVNYWPMRLTNAEVQAFSKG